MTRFKRPATDARGGEYSAGDGATEAVPAAFSRAPGPRSKVTILVFARTPLPGRCKRRLARAIGARRAAAIYRQLVLRTVHAALGAGLGRIELWLADRPSHPLFLGFRQRHGIQLRTQVRGDLGRRMAHALRRALREPDGIAILCGTDVADLEPQDFLAAAQALRAGAGAVLQPAADGGYVLIGLASDPGSALSAGIAWSSGREMAQTGRRLERRGLACRQLRQRLDIDHPEDLRIARARGLA